MTSKISDYWKINRPEQNQIKSAHPPVETKSYHVIGHLNVQCLGRASGIAVNVTVEAESPKQAAKKVKAGYTEYSPKDAIVSWLNDGPVIK